MDEMMKGIAAAGRMNGPIPQELGQNYSSYQQSVAAPAPKATPTDAIMKHLAAQIEQLRYLETRVRAVNSRLTGPMPVCQEKGFAGDSAQSGGFIAEMARLLEEQTTIIQNIGDQVGALEQVV